jgi:LPS sulfotransferase NodH
MESLTPYFAVGHSRSGTTWLQRLLNSHPEVLCKGSGMFFGRDAALHAGRTTLYAALDNSKDLRVWHGMRPNDWSGPDFEQDLAAVMRSFIQGVLGQALAKSGKEIVVDRTPHYVSYLDEIHTVFPEARVVHIIRDGRDSAISNLHAVWNTARDRGGPVDLAPEEIERRDAYLADPEGYLKSGRSIFTEQRINGLAKRWERTIRKGRGDGHKLFGAHYLELHYENLLEDTVTELEKLFDFLGASRDRETLEWIAEENSFERWSGRKPGEEQAGSFFRKGVAGDWKGVFNERDREVYKRHAGELLLDLGYEDGKE